MVMMTLQEVFDGQGEPLVLEDKDTLPEGVGCHYMLLGSHLSPRYWTGVFYVVAPVPRALQRFSQS